MTTKNVTNCDYKPVVQANTSRKYVSTIASMRVLSGEMGGIQIDQVFLFGAAILIAIPILMIFLSLALLAKANCWVNIIAGIAYVGVLVTIQLEPGEKWAHYTFYENSEAMFILLIVLHAWKKLMLKLEDSKNKRMMN